MTVVNRGEPAPVSDGLFAGIGRNAATPREVETAAKHAPVSDLRAPFRRVSRDLVIDRNSCRKEREVIAEITAGILR
jgi:hypothetical protein